MRVSLVELIVLAEYETYEPAVLIYDGELIYFVVPDDIVSFLKCCTLGCCNELLDGSHEFLDLSVK